MHSSRKKWLQFSLFNLVLVALLGMTLRYKIAFYLPFIDQQNLLDYMRQNPSEFVDFNIPWSVGLGLSVYFNEEFKLDSTGVFGFEKKFNSSLNFNGTFNLTPKWQFSVNGFYDLKTTKLQVFTMNISREMHCWQMSLSVTPVGPFRFFSVNISPKASILQDLKINRSRSFSNF